MSSYFVGQAVLPELQLRARVPASYGGTFAVRSTGENSVIICNGGVSQSDRTTAPAGSVTVARPYFDTESECLKVLRLKFSMAASTLAIPGTGRYFLFLHVKMASGSGGAVSWNDPVLGTSRIEAEFSCRATVTDTTGSGSEVWILLAAADAAENGTVTIRQQLHGEPHVMLADAGNSPGSEEGGSGSEETDSSVCSVSLGSESDEGSGSGEGSGSDEGSGSGEGSSSSFDADLYYVVRVTEYDDPDCQGRAGLEQYLVLQPPFYACRNYYASEVFVQSISHVVLSRGYETYAEAEAEKSRIEDEISSMSENGSQE